MIKDLRYSMPMHTEKNNEFSAKYIEMNWAYIEWLIPQIIELAEKAKQSVEPVNLFSDNGVVRFQVNRRNNKEAEIEKLTELKGPNDYAVPVLKVENKRGQLIAIVFGYACHPSVLNGYKWSGDYAGFAQLELESKYKDAIAMFFQGAGGDQNALPRHTVALARQYGQELAVAVERVLNEKMKQLSPKLKTVYSEKGLGYAKSEQTMTEQLKEVIKESSEYSETIRRYAKFALEKIEKGEVDTTSYPYPVQIWGVGEQLLIALGGEVLVGYSVELKKKYGREIFVLGYSNDLMGYIPTAKVLYEGGYEGSRSSIIPLLWASDIEEVILNEVSRLINEIRPFTDVKK